MERELGQVVQGRVVYDLGAGDLTYSHLMLDLGAERVIAIDKRPAHRPRSNLEIHRAYIHEVMEPEEIEVLFLSWPVNQVRGLDRWLHAARIAVYLGCNVGGTGCGDSRLFNHLIHREVLTHIPHEKNTFLVYGDYRDETRPPVGEEYAATCGRRLSFEKAQEEAEEVGHLDKTQTNPIPTYHIPMGGGATCQRCDYTDDREGQLPYCGLHSATVSPLGRCLFLTPKMQERVSSAG